MLQEQLRPSGIAILKANEEARIENFAGMFEIGGHAGFRVQPVKGGKHGYVYSVFRMNNNASRTQAVYEIYGGNRCQRTPISWAWGISGSDALELAVAIEHFAPARATVIEAIRRCEQLKSFEDRLDVRNSLKGKYMLLNLDSRAYEDLVKLPAFVAGVLNAREVIHPEERRDIKFYNIDIASKNRALLQSLKDQFGGSLNPRYCKGQIVNFVGKEVHIRDDSFILKMRDKASISILTFTEKYLLG